MTLQPYEKVIWRNSIRKGIWHRHTAEIQQISSENAEILNEENPTRQVLNWSDCHNIIVMNQHRQGTGNYYGISTGHYVRNYYGFSYHNSQTIGDLCFLDRLGNIAIVVRQIADPYGVLKLAKAELDNKQQQHQKNGAIDSKW
jgi:hypothetical protein